MVDGSPAVTIDPAAAALSAASAGGGGASRSKRMQSFRADAPTGGVPGASSGVVLHRHPAGSVAGLSSVQFLALPPKATVSVLYDGEEMGQAYLELEKI